jgi:cytochrome c5
MKKLTSAMIASMLLTVSGAVLADGQKTYQATCQACHNPASVIPNVPKLGDKAAWAPRIATGIDAMLAVSIKGKGAMPPKGACAACTDEDLKAAIEYMVSQSQ